MQLRTSIVALALGLAPASLLVSPGQAAAQGLSVGGQASGEVDSQNGAEGQASAGAQAGDTGAQKPKPSPAASPASPSKDGLPYLAKVYEGIRRIVLRDEQAALVELRQAAVDKPDRPEAFCHIGDAQRMAGAMEEAVAAYKSCIRFAEAASNGQYALIGRVGQAITLEAMPQRRDQARAVYETLAAGEQGPAKDLAQGRLKAMDAVVALDEQYAPVRERIKAREEKKAAEAAEAEEKDKKKRKR